MRPTSPSTTSATRKGRTTRVTAKTTISVRVEPRTPKNWEVLASRSKIGCAMANAASAATWRASTTRRLTLVRASDLWPGTVKDARAGRQLLGGVDIEPFAEGALEEAPLVVGMRALALAGEQALHQGVL